MVWEKGATKPLYKFRDHTAAVKAIDWNPHSSGVLASGGGTVDKHIRFWNTNTGQAIGAYDTGSQVRKTTGCCEKKKKLADKNIQFSTNSQTLFLSRSATWYGQRRRTSLCRRTGTLRTKSLCGSIRRWSRSRSSRATLTAYCTCHSRLMARRLSRAQATRRFDSGMFSKRVKSSDETTTISMA